MPPLLEALDRLIEAATVLRKERLLKSAVAKAERQIALAFVRQGREFLTRLAKQKGRFAVEESLREGTAEELGWEPMFNAAELETLSMLEAPIGSVAQAALLAGARETIRDLAVEMSFELDNPRAVAFLKGRAAVRVTLINATTREQLRTMLTEAMENGWSYAKTAKAVNEKFDGFAGKLPQEHLRSRAELVAVQEAGEAYEAGTHAVGQELQAMGLEMEHAWLTVGDSRVSDQCWGDQGAGWIPLGDAFPSGNERPPGHVACRCTGLMRRRDDD
jgi:hypothetical protein